MRFKDKVCFVTGGGSGIGRATCERFAAEGGKVVVINRSEKSGNETVRAIEAAVADGQIILIHCTHGRDRTGFVAAAYQILALGWSLEAALAERTAHGVDDFMSRLTNQSFTGALERLPALPLKGPAPRRSPRADDDS